MAIIQGTSGNVAAVNTANALSVNTANTSVVRIMSENDDGSSMGGNAFLRSPETSNDYRLRTGVDTMLFTETFNATTQNTANWAYTFNTLTVAAAGAGVINFSNVQGTTSAHGAFMRTFQYFPVVGTAPLSLEITHGLFTAAPVVNENIVFGMGLPTAAVTEPTDGAWVRITSAGMSGEARFSGTTTSTGIMVPIENLALGTVIKTAIVIAEDSICFWNDDVLVGRLVVPAGQGQPFVAGSLPLFMMKYNSGAVSNTNQWRIADVTVTLQDICTNLPYSHQQALAGMMSYQGQNGMTMGSTASFGTIASGSSTNPTSAAASNTAPLTAGLGGVVVMNAIAGSPTDLIATSYQNPAGTINITGRNLIITGVRISSCNLGAAVASTPTTLQWSLGFGHTAASMATAESASFTTATAKTPRRVPLGFQSAAIGTVVGGLYGPDIVLDFQAAPIVVRPGEFINTHVKQIVGTATASQSITSLVTFMGYWV